MVGNERIDEAVSMWGVEEKFRILLVLEYFGEMGN